MIIARQRKGDYGSTDAIFYAARDEADDTLMPGLVEKAHAASMKRMRTGVTQLTHCAQRLGLHARFDGSAFDVELIQPLGDCARHGRVVGEQALDADGHVVDSPAAFNLGPPRTRDLWR